MATNEELYAAYPSTRGGRGAPSMFPRKLFQILAETNPDIITWDKDGLSFHIVDQATFVDRTMPRFYRHNKLTSFQRQLNLYGFKKRARDEPSPGYYYHPSFRRDHPELLDLVRRTYPSGVKPADGEYSSPDEDPRRNSPTGSPRRKALRQATGGRHTKGMVPRHTKKPYLDSCRATAWGVERRPLPINKAMYDELVLNKPSRPWFFSGSPAITEATVRRERAAAAEARRKMEAEAEAETETAMSKASKAIAPNGELRDENGGRDDVDCEGHGDGRGGDSWGSPNCQGNYHPNGANTNGSWSYRRREDSPSGVRGGNEPESSYTRYVTGDDGYSVWNGGPGASSGPYGAQREGAPEEAYPSPGDTRGGERFHQRYPLDLVLNNPATGDRIPRRVPSSSLFPAGILRDTRQHPMEPRERAPRPMYLSTRERDELGRDGDAAAPWRPMWNGIKYAWQPGESRYPAPKLNEERDTRGVKQETDLGRRRGEGTEKEPREQQKEAEGGGGGGGGGEPKRKTTTLATGDWEGSQSTPKPAPPGPPTKEEELVEAPPQARRTFKPSQREFSHEGDAGLLNEKTNGHHGLPVLRASAAKPEVKDAVSPPSNARTMEAT